MPWCPQCSLHGTSGASCKLLPFAAAAAGGLPKLWPLIAPLCLNRLPCTERLRQLFCGVPSSPLNHVSLAAQRLLCTGQHSPEGSGQVQQPLGQPLALSQQGQALALACVPHAVAPSPAAPRLQRLRRLLLLEEVALEQDVTR